jgi:HPt (histidine-containing phosphotransfer) domain-containing protein
MVQRLEVLQEADNALYQGNLSAELQQSACHAAHKLAGVLGMFNREDGTNIARKIEGIFHGNTKLKPPQKEEVLTLIKSLVELLNLTENIDRNLQDLHNLQDNTIPFPIPHSPLWVKHLETKSLVSARRYPPNTSPLQTLPLPTLAYC